MIRYLRNREMIKKGTEDMRRGRDYARGYNSRVYDSRGRDSREYDRENYYKDYLYDGRDNRSFDMRISRDYDLMDMRRRRDYANDMNYDYNDDDIEKEYHEDLCEWIEKLEKKDRFGLTFEQVIQQAKNMGVKFKEYDEKEFYATYLAMESDYKSIGNDPNSYIRLAKEFLEDDDIKVSPREKLCIYFYKIVKGE